MEWQGRKSVQFSIFDATFLMKFSYLSNLGDEEKIRKKNFFRILKWNLLAMSRPMKTLEEEALKRAAAAP